VPYALPYLATSRLLGPRDAAEVRTYSARPISYVVSPPQNRLWGWTAARWGGPERNLYPGIVAVILGILGIIWRRPRPVVWLYALLAGVSVMLSFGPAQPLYAWVMSYVPMLQGLRAPSRFAVIGSCALAMLAGFGIAAAQDRMRLDRVRRVAFIVIALALVSVDFANSGMILGPVVRNLQQIPVYRVLRSAGPGVVVELPMPTAGALPGREAQYEYWSMAHWNPLVNGYSGYYTPEYIETLGRMESFPDEGSIARLRGLNVRYVVVHRALYEPDDYTALLLRIGNRPELRAFGKYADSLGEADLFVLDAGR
jgi:hypothetical protein